MSRLVAPLLIVWLAAPAAADMRDVRNCVEENMPRRSIVQELTLRVQEASGEETFSARFRLYWRRLAGDERRILLRFTAPDDLKGAAVLVQTRPGRERHVYLYLPEMGKPRRVMSRGQLDTFLGQANLGIEELELLLDPVRSKRKKLLPQSRDVEGRRTWVLEERNSGGADSRYARTLTFIDREYCIPVRAELFGADGSTKKVLSVDVATVTREVESWVPRNLIFHDLERNSDTVLQVDDITVDSEFSPALLTVEALAR